MANKIEGLGFEQRHGKQRVRVARVWRNNDGRHSIVEWNVGISLLSDCVNAYTRGDNSELVATDTMNNSVYVKAKEYKEELSVEEFAVRLAKHFTSLYQQVTAAIVKIVEKPWERAYVDGQPHEHGFKLGSEKHTTEVIFEKSGALRLTSGIEGLSLLKTTKSGFEGFIRDKYTALPDTRERILATEITASWKYQYESIFSIPQKPLYFTERYLNVKKALADTFYGPPKEGVYSPSVQSTLFHMAKTVLKGFPDIAAVQLKMPNIHFLPVNLSNKDNTIVKFMESKEATFSSHSPSLSPTPTTRWWSENTVAIVTGANKGIGFAVVKRMAELGVTVILTARDKERGCKAVEALRAQGLHNVAFSCLDVSDPSSIKSFTSWFKKSYAVLDILVNNAAVSFNDINENSVEHAETVMKTNFYGPKLLTDALLPMFLHSTSSVGRILNVSSRLGLLNVSDRKIKPDQYIKIMKQRMHALNLDHQSLNIFLQKLRNPSTKQVLESETLSEKDIEGVVSLFLEDVKSGRWKSQGWPEVWTDYAVSKLALNSYTRVLAKQYEGRGMSVNSFCPGFTKTSMTRCKGDHTADDAASVGVRLALLPPEEIPTGKFFLWVSTSSGNVIPSKL